MVERRQQCGHDAEQASHPSSLHTSHESENLERPRSQPRRVRRNEQRCENRSGADTIVPRQSSFVINTVYCTENTWAGPRPQCARPAMAH